MRLLKCSEDGNFSLTWFRSNNVPPYAILSHTWVEGEEVTFQEMSAGAGRDKPGYRKIRYCGRQAHRAGLEYFWVDTCCIDKTSSAELSESIVSMYRWYEEAAACYVYLSDLEAFDLDHAEQCLRGLRWFGRGWTLQELIAPKEMEFFTASWTAIGTKESLGSVVSSITGIPLDVLTSRRTLLSIPVAQRMSWAADRSTSQGEDMAYCLLGLFDVYLPPLYGEGIGNAFRRLQEEIIKMSYDESIFCWHGIAKYPGALAESPADFRDMGNVRKVFHQFSGESEYHLTNRGLRIRLRTVHIGEERYIGLLGCTDRLEFSTDKRARWGIYLTRSKKTGFFYREHRAPEIFHKSCDNSAVQSLLIVSSTIARKEI
jgi:hypothetical protein